MENKSLELQRKKGLNLMMKILSVALIPLLILLVVAAISIRSVGTTVSERLVEHELNATVYAMEMTLTALASGDYSCVDDQLYKGDYNISENQEFMDEFKERTGVDVTIFWGTVRMATSIYGADGNRVVGTEISKDVYDHVSANGSYFTSNVNVEGIPYFGYYQTLLDENGKQIGVIFTGMESNSVHAIYISLLWGNITLMLIVAVVACLLIIFIMRIIIQAISRVIAHLNDVANGDLEDVVSENLVERSDEIGNIARAVSSLIEGLGQIVMNIHNSAVSLNGFTNNFKNSFRTIDESLKNVNVAVEEIANGATNQANEMQKVSMQITDMGEAIAKTTNNIDSLIDSTKEMRNHNYHLNNTLDELIDISNRTKDSIDEVNEQTNITNKSVMDIGSAIDMITDIASQTNLLSLNASIEAARAGEQGRGFAVVADEIRQLADQSSESAKKIGQIVEELIQNSNASVQTMNGVLEEISDQNQKLDETRRIFAELNSEVDSVVVSIDNISGEVSSINNVKNDILQSMDGLASVAEQNAASTEETSASMIDLGGIVDDCYHATQELVEIAEDMSDNVNKFRIG